MNTALFWLCIICIVCIIFFVISVKGIIYHCNRVESWTEIPTTEEYMECLIIGWSSWMCAIGTGVGAFFTLMALVLSIIK